MKATEPYYRRKIILALFLSGLSGFIDILGLFSIGGMFLSFMSGNSTRFAFYLADGHFKQAFPYLLIISGFVFGAFLGDQLKSHFPNYKLISILSVETLLILSSYVMLHFTFPGEWTHLPLTIAMGLQNAIQIEVGDKIIGFDFDAIKAVGETDLLGIGDIEIHILHHPTVEKARLEDKFDLALFVRQIDHGFFDGERFVDQLGNTDLSVKCDVGEFGDIDRFVACAA